MGKDTDTTSTIREALLKASSLLADQGAADGRRNAELLLQHLLGWDRSRLLLEWNERFPEYQSLEWAKLLRRRCEGEPVQYIIGEQEFYGLPFVVNPDVLIPRPETELLVETIMKLGRELWPEGAVVGAENDMQSRSVDNAAMKQRLDESKPVQSGPIAVDIGTGSGAIAVSLAVLNPSWRVVACDLSPEAIETAAHNAQRNRVGGRVTFCQGDLLEPIIERGMGVDILVSNPPYIPSRDIPGLQREVRDYEPMLALDGGDDGLICYRRMLEQMERLAVVPVLAGFEVGFGQARQVAAMMEKRGWWERVEIVLDYAGIGRHVIGRSPSFPRRVV